MKRFLSFLKEYYLMVLFLSFISVMCCIYIPGVVSNFEDLYFSEAPAKSGYIEEYKDDLQSAGYNVSAVSPSSPSGLSAVLKVRSKLTEAMMNEVDYMGIDDFMLSANAWFCKNVGMEYIPGTSFVKLENGTLTSVINEQDSAQSRYNDITLLSIFNNALKENGTETIYVNCPYKNTILSPLLANYLIGDKDFDLNEYITSALNEFGIANIDVVSEMKADNISVQDIFYKTDHHWRSEYGIYTAQLITEYLNNTQRYNIDTSVYNLDNYNEKVYAGSLLGSTGINSTLAFTQAEDFYLYSPKSQSTYSISIPSKNVSDKGDFDVMINHEKLDDESYWPFNAYGAYIYANSAYVNIKNESTTDNHKILVIKDSFANAVIPYLAQSFGEIDVVDVRSSQEDYFDDSVLELIENNDYDSVLFIYSDPSEFDRLFLDTKTK